MAAAARTTERVWRWSSETMPAGSIPWPTDERTGREVTVFLRVGWRKIPPLTARSRPFSRAHRKIGRSEELNLEIYSLLPYFRSSDRSPESDQPQRRKDAK